MIRRLLMLGIVLLLVAGTITGCGKSVDKQIAEQLELGNKYLTEADYEQAIVAFNKVIKLDEKNTAGYVGLMEAQLKNENTDEAIQCGESVIEKLGDDALRNKLFEAYQQKQLEIEGDIPQKLALYEKMLQLDPEQKSMYLELAELYEIQHDYEQGMEVLKDGISNVSNPEELRQKLHEMLDSYREYLVDTVKEKFKADCWGYSFQDFDGDGNYDLFALGSLKEQNEAIVCYCGNNGKICEQVYTINVQENNQEQAFCNVEYQEKVYFCPYYDTDGYAFGVEDGKAFILAERLEVPEGEMEQIEAYFNEAVGQKVGTAN